MKECLRQRNVFSGLQRASHNQDPPRDGILEEVLTEKERTRAQTRKLQHWKALGQRCGHSLGPCRNWLKPENQLTATDMLQVSAWMWPRHSLFTKLYESLKSVVKAMAGEGPIAQCVLAAPSKGRGFESLQERWENFLLQGQLSQCADSYFGIRSTPVLPPQWHVSKRSRSFCQKWQVAVYS